MDEWEAEAAHNPKDLLELSMGGCSEKVLGIVDGESDFADERISLVETLHTHAIESLI